MYQKGDVVLIAFPYTDFSTSKTRPALVISTSDYEEKTGNIIVAMITSKSCFTPYDYELKGWRGANLLAKSWVRLKVATISPSLIKFKPGSITQEDVVAMNSLIHKTFSYDQKSKDK